jgi:lipoyl(octanoyl) transferase
MFSSPPISDFQDFRGFKFEVRRHEEPGPSSRGSWSYAQLDARQRELVESSPDELHLLLSEVAPVITLGRRAEPQKELLFPIPTLQQAGTEVYPCDRGGLATWHGPGQWVLFAVGRLETLTGDPRGVRKAVHALLQVAYDTSREEGGSRLSQELELISDGPRTGVWAGSGKLASVGVAVHRGFLLHGLSLNVSRHPRSFHGLRPCGLDGVFPAFLFEGSGMDPRSFERVGKTLLKRAAEAFNRLRP